MSLTGNQINRIIQVIREAYTRDDLRFAVRVCMEEEFDDLVPDKAFRAQVFDLVQWADKHDRALELLSCAYEHNKTNDALRTLHADLARGGKELVDSRRACTVPPHAPTHLASNLN